VDKQAEWRAVTLEERSSDILKLWYDKAQDRIFGYNGRQRDKECIDISDDDEDTEISKKWVQKKVRLGNDAKSIAKLWLRTARITLDRNRR